MGFLGRGEAPEKKEEQTAEMSETGLRLGRKDPDCP